MLGYSEIIIMKLSQDTLIPISLTVALVGGFGSAVGYIRGIEKDVQAATKDIFQHEIILQVIPTIKEDLSVIRNSQMEMKERLDRMMGYLKPLKENRNYER